jgi:Flp pilus assembly protein TadD
MTQFRTALGLSRVDAGTRSVMATKLLEKERWAEAEELLRDAVALAPDQSTLRINLGVALWQQDRRADAVAAWRETQRREPGNAEVTDLLERVSKGQEQEREQPAQPGDSTSGRPAPGAAGPAAPSPPDG